MNIVRIIFQVILVSVIVEATEATEAQQRLNYGVIFKPLGTTQPATDYWMHTCQIELPTLHRELQAQKLPCKNTGACQYYRSSFNLANEIRKDVATQFNVSINRIKALIPEIRNLPIENSRSKRSLLPFIGELSSSLFGTASEEDVSKLAKYILLLKSNQDKILHSFQHHEGNLASFMKNVDNRFVNAVRGIEINHNMVNKLASNLISATSYIQGNVRLSNIMDKLMHIALRVLNRVEELVQGFHQLSQGKLSPYLIPQEIMHHIIANIKQKLSKQYSQFQIANVRPSDYYSHIKFMYTRHANSIFIALKIPVTSFQNALKVYSIHTYPVPLNHSTNHASQLLSHPKFLAISSDKQYYAHFNEEEWKQCIGHHQKHCPFRYPLSPISQSTCATALYLQTKADIKRLCNFRFLHNAITPSITEISSGNILVTNISEIVLQCPKRTSTIPGCTFCVIKFPCLCSVTTSKFYLPPRLDNCHNTTRITKLHAVNLALLQQFFEKELTHITGDTLFEEPMDIKIPGFNIYQHNLSNVLSNDHKQHLNLMKMAEATKSEQQIYQSLADSLAAENFNDLSSSAWPLSTKVTSYLALGLATLATSLCIYLGLKLRSLTSMLILLQNAKPVQLAPTSEKSNVLSYFSSTPTILDSHDQEAQNYAQEWQYLLIVSIIITIMCIIMVSIFKVIRRHHHHTTLCIELSTGSSCVLVEIMSLPMCPKYWHFQASEFIENVCIKGYVKPHVQINWESITITNTKTKQIIPMVKTVPVHPIKAFQVRKMLKEHCNVFLLFQHHNCIEYFKICPTSCNGCHCHLV